MAYPHKWSPISCRSSAGQGKLAGQRPTFYRCSTPTNLMMRTYHENNGDQEQKRNDDGDHVVERLALEIKSEADPSVEHFEVLVVFRVSFNGRTSHVPQIYTLL